MVIDHLSIPFPGAEQLHSLGVSLEQRLARWEDYVDALQRFVAREGHADVPGIGNFMGGGDQ